MLDFFVCLGQLFSANGTSVYTPFQASSAKRELFFRERASLSSIVFC